MGQLGARREKTQTHVPVRDVVAGAIIRLAPEKRHLTGVLERSEQTIPSRILIASDAPDRCARGTIPVVARIGVPRIGGKP
jgi:hypothetical protein